MKYKILISAFLIISLILCGCNLSNQQTTSKFYYCYAEIEYGLTDKIIHYEQRSKSPDPLDYELILSSYLEGPKSSDLKSPFPAGTALVSFSVDQQIASIVLNNVFSDLSGIELTLACACLSLTVEDISGCAQVQISAQNTLLDNKQIITINTNDLKLYDNDI